MRFLILKDQNLVTLNFSNLVPKRPTARQIGPAINKFRLWTVSIKYKTPKAIPNTKIATPVASNRFKNFSHYNFATEIIGLPNLQVTHASAGSKSKFWAANEFF